MAHHTAIRKEVFSKIPNTDPEQGQEAVQAIEQLITVQGEHVATRKDLEIWGERLSKEIAEAQTKGIITILGGIMVIATGAGVFIALAS